MHPKSMCLLALATMSGCQPQARFSAEEFAQRSKDFERDLVEDYTDIRRITIETAEVKLDAWERGQHDERPTIDILILSAGGPDGAFGAGFLQGWGEVQDPHMARPRFDRVTGSSTGALMSPFAMVGTDEAYQDLVDFYSNPDPRWIGGSPLWSFITGGESLFTTARLQRTVREGVTPEMLKQIGERRNESGILLVGTTNLDLGRFRVFDLTRIAAEGDEERFEDVLLASAAIPGVFPPIDIDGWTYADGAAVANLFLGVDRDLIWREDAGPWWDPKRGVPKLRVRHWIVVNGKLELDDEQIPRTWGSIGRRGLAQLLLAANVRSLQQLDVMRRLAKNRPDVEFEVYWVAIPRDAELPKPETMFDTEYMRALVELGRRMGADPGSWHTESPLLELDWERGSDDQTPGR